MEANFKFRNICSIAALFTDLTKYNYQINTLTTATGRIFATLSHVRHNLHVLAFLEKLF